MAQTTAARSARAAKVEFSTNGSSWTDVSGIASKVDIGGGDLKVEAVDTFTGHTPILTAGKYEAATVKVTSVYTESASEPYTLSKTAYDAASLLYIRWTPWGTGSGLKQFTASGYVTKMPIPSGDSGDAKAIMMDTEIKVATIAETTSA